MALGSDPDASLDTADPIPSDETVTDAALLYAGCEGEVLVPTGHAAWDLAATGLLLLTPPPFFFFISSWSRASSSAAQPSSRSSLAPLTCGDSASCLLCGGHMSPEDGCALPLLMD